jgi:hypothetical protein
VAVELFANQAQTTVTSGGTTAPAPGAQESWTVTSSASFPAASGTAAPPTQFHILDPQLASEIIAVTNITGSTWTVTRGAEGTTPVAHSAGFTVYQVATAGALANLRDRPATITVAASNASTLWKNAADYVCSGSNDDVTINAAMAALPSSYGGTVMLSDGQFTISNPLIPTISNTRLLGQGLNATIVQAANGVSCNGYQFDTATQAYHLIFCCIEGMTFWGGPGAASGYGCHINYDATHSFWDFYLRDVWFRNWAQDGFWSTGGHGYVLDHVISEFNGGNGITFAGGFTDSPPRIINGTVKLNTGNGISISCVDAYVGHMEISSNSGSYGLILSASGCKAVGNQIIDNTGSGVHATGGAEGIEVIGNTIGANGVHGLLLDDANCAVTGNFFLNNSRTTPNTADDVNITTGTFTAQGNMITGNVMDGANTSRYGINVAVLGDHGCVSIGNRIINEATAAINNVAADTTIMMPGTAVTYAQPTANNATQTTLTGTSAGQVLWVQTDTGSAFKRVMAFLNGYENTTGTPQTITFGTAFSRTPVIITQPAGFGATVSTTTLTLPASMGSPVSGTIIIEGF